MIGAFFDVVGTIYRGAFWRDISDYNKQRKRNRFWTWAYLIWHMAGWPLNLAGLLSDERWYNAWARASRQAAGRLGEIIYSEFLRQVKQDIPIWESKVYTPRPLLCDGDGQIAEFRRWARQFYSEAAGE